MEPEPNRPVDNPTGQAKDLSPDEICEFFKYNYFHDRDAWQWAILDNNEHFLQGHTRSSEYLNCEYALRWAIDQGKISAHQADWGPSFGPKVLLSDLEGLDSDTLNEIYNEYRERERQLGGQNYYEYNEQRFYEEEREKEARLVPDLETIYTTYDESFDADASIPPPDAELALRRGERENEEPSQESDSVLLELSMSRRQWSLVSQALAQAGLSIEQSQAAIPSLDADSVNGGAPSPASFQVEPTGSSRDTAETPPLDPRITTLQDALITQLGQAFQESNPSGDRPQVFSIGQGAEAWQAHVHPSGNFYVATPAYEVACAGNLKTQEMSFPLSRDTAQTMLRMLSYAALQEEPETEKSPLRLEY